MSLKSIWIVCLLGFIISCKKKEEEPQPSTEVRLLELTLEYNNSLFETEISGSQVTLIKSLPFGIDEVNVNSIEISENATCNIAKDDKLSVVEKEHSIIITAEDGVTTRTYTLTFETPEFSSIVEEHGLLQVSGNRIINKNGEAISFAGNSFFWSNNDWGGERYYNESVVSWLKQDWNTTIVRAAMGVEDPGGYLDDRDANKNRVFKVVDAAIAEGMYVIIDWHSHHAEDYTYEAVEFFEEIATKYGGYDNIIYEIYNEPLAISWKDDIKPYAETVISAIRAIDQDNIIVVGTPNWSQDVNEPAVDPITISSNIAYTLHFYTIHHQQALRDKATQALNSGIAIITTEWGSLGYTQDDPETEFWMDWCRDNDMIHCSWAVNDKVEEWSILKQGSSTEGNWAFADLTESGKLSKTIISTWE